MADFETVDSGAAALSQRQLLENAYQAAAEGEILEFLRGVEEASEQAVSAGQAAALAFTVMALWQASINRLAERFPDRAALVETLKASDIPQVALATAERAVAVAVSGQAPANLGRWLATQLGLSKSPLPGGEYGRMLVDGEAETRSWDAAAREVARTVATADFGESMLQQLRAEGYTHKRWMNRYDSRVRDTHVLADRQTVTLEEAFTVGSDRMQYPGDRNASLAETINCRCVLIGVKFGRHALDHPEGTTPWNNPRPL